MKTVIIGADGQLGSDLVSVLSQSNDHEIVALTLADIDIASRESVASALTAAQPNVVINTAAMHHVEQCEEDPARSFAVNAEGARNLSLLCNDLGATLLHISTDYVFDGEKRAPYVEDDLPIPLNVYANSKLAGEHFVQSTAESFYIVRVSGLYGRNVCLAKGQNFVSLMLKLASERDEIAVVDDEILTPTWTMEVGHQLETLLASDAENGIYHATAEGQCSWYDFARKIFDVSGSTVHLRKAEPGEFPVKVNRPSYSVLENANLKKNSLNRMRAWDDALESFLS